jgi:hypothetical protein
MFRSFATIVGGVFRVTMNAGVNFQSGSAMWYAASLASSTSALRTFLDNGNGINPGIGGIAKSDANSLRCLFP